MSSLTIKNFQERPKFPDLEHQVLDFWDETEAFKKQVEQKPKDKEYVFYDGPPFATGSPHYGHILASTIKDVIPRYFAMKGYRVERVWGWDCHGLPIENIVEQELDLKGGKKGIEAMGVDKFNAACRAAIWRFDQEWETMIRRIGRWVDFKNSYKTMDTTYMESVWWAFKTLFDKGLVYQGRKVILYCPRCSTPLSNFEIAMDNSYQDKESPSTVYKYKVKGESDTFLLAWSTTPWNKLATPALAVNPELTYVKAKQGRQQFILAESTLSILKDEPYQVVEKFQGKDLEKLEFELHYDFYPDRGGKKAGVVIADDYVTADEGTGIVTLAIYGEDDYRVMTAHNIQLVEHVDEQGKFKPEVTPWPGMYILKANPLINQDLEDRGLIYSDKTVTHPVPVCYRCQTRLYHAPIPAWFIDIQKLKADLVAQNENINWYPGHLKHGRFGKGLETAPDWNISRARYWGTPMPIWISPDGQARVIGSIEELQTWAVDRQAVKNLTDIHREYVDHLEIWVDDDKTIKGNRIPEVFDCWVESGSMPFASQHFPFDNEAKFKSRHPAQFISEYIAQTRAWFYTLHVLSVGLFGSHTFENALTTGTILAQDGTKMSKSRKNFPDPGKLIDLYGVDALRFYLMNSVVMKADNLNFSEDQVKEVHQKLLNTLWNTFSFFKLYSNVSVPNFPSSTHLLDRWVVSQVTDLTQTVTQALDNYDTPLATRHLQEFVTDLSTWYLRRSRDRLRTDQQAQETFAWVLHRLVHLLAPITPFISEVIYHNLTGSDHSLHLNDWPQADLSLHEPELETQMSLARKIVESLHALRQTHSLMVRQPLAAWSVDTQNLTLLNNQLELIEIINLETNIKNFATDSSFTSQNQVKKLETGFNTSAGPLTVYLDIELSPQLKQEGLARQLIRQIQGRRKKLNVKLDQTISLTLPQEAKDLPQELIEEIKTKTLVSSLDFGSSLEVVAQ